MIKILTDITIIFVSTVNIAIMIIMILKIM